MTFGDPSENEKRCLLVGVGEHLEDLVGVRLDPAREVVPPVATRHRVERRHLEVLFDIERQAMNRKVGYRSHGYRAPSPRVTTRRVSVAMRRSRRRLMCLT